MWGWNPGSPVWETETLPLYQQSRSFYWTQLMLQWFLRFSEFPEFNEFNESSAPFRENWNNNAHSSIAMPCFTFFSSNAVLKVVSETIT